MFVKKLPAGRTSSLLIYKLPAGRANTLIVYIMIVIINGSFNKGIRNNKSEGRTRVFKISRELWFELSLCYIENGTENYLFNIYLFWENYFLLKYIVMKAGNCHGIIDLLCNNISVVGMIYNSFIIY